MASFEMEFVTISICVAYGLLIISRNTHFNGDVCASVDMSLEILLRLWDAFINGTDKIMCRRIENLKRELANLPSNKRSQTTSKKEVSHLKSEWG